MPLHMPRRMTVAVHTPNMTELRFNLAIYWDLIYSSVRSRWSKSSTCIKIIITTIKYDSSYSITVAELPVRLTHNRLQFLNDRFLIFPFSLFLNL